MTGEMFLKRLVSRYDEYATESLEKGQQAPDPIRTLRMSEAVLNESERLSEEERNQILPIDRRSRLTWLHAIVHMRDRLYTVQIRPDAKLTVEPDPLVGIAAALTAVDEEFRRLGRVIDGNNSQPDKSAELRTHIYGGRTPVRSKAGYETELRLRLAALKTLPNPSPPVRAMIPRLEEVLERLDATAPAPSGRVATQHPGWVWNPKVEHATMALHICLGEFLSWVAAAGSEHSYNRFSRIIIPPQRTAPQNPSLEDGEGARSQEAGEGENALPDPGAAVAGELPAHEEAPAHDLTPAPAAVEGEEVSERAEEEVASPAGLSPDDAVIFADAVAVEESPPPEEGEGETPSQACPPRLPSG